jgi:hypothetical protein
MNTDFMRLNALTDRYAPGLVGRGSQCQGVHGGGVAGEVHRQSAAREDDPRELLVHGPVDRHDIRQEAHVRELEALRQRVAVVVVYRAALIGVRH